MNSCPSLEQLAELFTEDLAESQREELEDHLGECVPCQQQLQELAVDPQDWDPWEQRLRNAQVSWPSTLTPSSITGEDTDSWPHIEGYELLDELGRGGMGVVYKARQLSLGRLVALKVLRPGHQQDPEYRRRFRTEAEAIARLHHPNIVQIYDFGESSSCLYLALELIEGGNLAQRLRDNTLPALEAAQLMEALARAIQLAHQAGILHRDLKPANVLLASDREGQGEESREAAGGTGYVAHGEQRYLPKVTDFGLARQLTGQSETRTGQVMGTPSYMSPEQVMGTRGWSTPAVDIYALGAVLYEGLTGRPPFRAESTYETFQLVVREEPVPPTRLQSRIPRDLETICLKCLRKPADQRYATGADLADDLHRFLAGKPIRARPVSWWTHLVKWCWRRPVTAALSLCLALGVVVLLAVWVYFTASLQQLTEDLRQETQRAREESVRAERSAQQVKTQYRIREVDYIHATGMWEQQYQILLREPSLRNSTLIPTRQRLLRQTLQWRARMIARFPQHLEATWLRARAYHQLGLLTHDVGTPEKATYYLGRAYAIGQAVRKMDPDRKGVAYDLGTWALDLASVLQRQGRHQKAEGLLGEALGWFQKQKPQELNAKQSLPLARARVHTQLASLLLRTDRMRLAEAEAAFTAARKEWKADVKSGAQVEEGRELELTLELLAGLLQDRQGKQVQAQMHYQRMRNLARALARDSRGKTAPMLALATACSRLGNGYWQQGMKEEAITLMEQALACYATVDRAYPEIHRHRRRLGEVLLTLADMYKSTAPQKAAQTYRKATLLQSELTRQMPDVWLYARDFAETLAALAEMSKSSFKFSLLDFLSQGILVLQRWRKGEVMVRSNGTIHIYPRSRDTREGKRAVELLIALHQARGRFLQQQGEETRANQDFEEARRLQQGSK